MIRFLTICSLLSISCNDGFNSAPDPPDPPEAVIIRVDVSPNPVKIGETVTFVCVIEDSSNTNLKYIWRSSLESGSIETLSNKYSVIVNIEAGDYTAYVRANDTTQSLHSPSMNFNFQVIK